MIAVPLSGKMIAAQTRITPEHLIDPATNRPLLVHLRPGDVRRLGDHRPGEDRRPGTER